MAFHQRVQAILLAGVRFSAAPASAPVAVPAALAVLASAIAPEHAACNKLAINAGNRYRSAFWSIYLLSASAVLCAVLPLALGWDDQRSDMHALAGYWVVLEVVVIAVLGLTYWRGHLHDWQGRWLASRTEAELAWYLPLLAPLVVPAPDGAAPNWYMRLPGEQIHFPPSELIDTLCARLETDAQASLRGAWDDPQFVAAYVAWTIGQLEGQRYYHRRLEQRSEALTHRVHKINAWLFGLTMAGALSHLVIHSMWLSFVTIFFPALGASLHGALAQTEAYRLAATSRRLAHDLALAIAAIRGASGEAGVRAAIGAALVLILDEHKDWHMLVRPHHLPLG